jgi:hypothetical protein
VKFSISRELDAVEVKRGFFYVQRHLFAFFIIPYYIDFNGPVMASMKIKTVQTILLSAV